MASVHNGKADLLAQTPKKNKGIKLLTHVFKVYKSALDEKRQGIKDINKKQYGFMSSKRTVNALFISRQFAEIIDPKVRNTSMCLLI